MDGTFDINSTIERLPGVNPRIAEQLHKIEIVTIHDLLFYLPRRYQDFSNLAAIIDLNEGQQASIKGTVKSIRAYPGFRGHPNRAEAVISDQTDSIKAVWFNQSYLAKTLKVGEEIFLAGTVRRYKGLQLQNPIYEKVNPDAAETVHTARIIPIYRLPANLPLRTMRTLIFSALDVLPQLQENLPADLIDALALPNRTEMIKNLHFPESKEILQKAENRAAFEEIFETMLAVERQKRKTEKQSAPSIKFNKHLIQKFLGGLPFELTTDQKRAAWEILQDMQKPVPMNRLLEGDVGSGKTLVAFTAALESLENKIQTALLCPTEILAEQHYLTALKYYASYPQISIILLTSKSAKINGQKTSKKHLAEEIAHGGPQFVISTHALLQKNLKFKNLGLVIIDEQHRFGVRQRAALFSQNAKRPHLLSMTATPIPRTLKLTIFGDLAISRIKKMPSGRKPVITKLVEQQQRQKAYDFIKKELKAGRQAFVVTPLLEESDALGVKAATTELKNLSGIFPDFKLGLIHGKMSATQKEQIMQDFLTNKLQILVSTSVIEVGVDVPNASVIIIEAAERFGLAQLHQLRGRVGRSEQQSYCFLFSSAEDEQISDQVSAASIERLQKFTKISDGFELAELDLNYRGFGTIFGEQQSGFFHFNYFSFSEHQNLLDQSKQFAKKILDQDPELKNYSELEQATRDIIVHME